LRERNRLLLVALQLDGPLYVVRGK
jgi:hypothetical protein